MIVSSIIATRYADLSRCANSTGVMQNSRVMHGRRLAFLLDADLSDTLIFAVNTRRNGVPNRDGRDAQNHR